MGKAISGGDKVGQIIGLAAGSEDALPQAIALGVRLVPEITIGGAPGVQARIEWSLSLGIANSWAVLTNLVVGPDGASLIDLSVGSTTRFYRVVSSPQDPAGMVLIPAGSFIMGNTFSEGNSGELPVHSVFVSPFYMDKREVTKALWDEVKAWSMGQGYGFENSGAGKAPDHPVHSIDWYDAVKWCNARSLKAGLVPAYYTDAALTQVYQMGQVEPYVKWDAGYRLPTEAEWEKAARGGVSGHRFPWGDTDSIMHSRANYFSLARYAYDLSPTGGYHPIYAEGGYPYTSPVGSFAANGYGLFDMSGNLWEQCWDGYGPYLSESQTDPRGPTGTVNGRVLRGGNWSNSADYLRCASRDLNVPGTASYYVGFRCMKGFVTE